MDRLEIKKFLPFFIGLLIIGILISKIGYETLLANIRGASKSLVLFSSFIFFITIIIKAIRWTFLVKPLAHISLKEASMVYFIGQVTNEIFPTGSGELLRMYFVKKISRISFATPISAILFERVFDLFLLLLISLFGIIFIIQNISPNLEYFQSIFIITFFVIFIFLSILFKPNWIKNILINLSKKFNFFIRPLYSLEKYELGRNKIKDRRIIVVLLMSIIAWNLEALTQFILVKSFGYSIPFQIMLAIISISWLVGTFSFLPGGIGAREVTFALLVSLLGIPLEDGSSIAILYRSIVYIFFGVFGASSLYMICHVTAKTS